MQTYSATLLKLIMVVLSEICSVDNPGSIVTSLLKESQMRKLSIDEKWEWNFWDF